MLDINVQSRHRRHDGQMKALWVAMLPEQPAIAESHECNAVVFGAQLRDKFPKFRRGPKRLCWEVLASP